MTLFRSKLPLCDPLLKAYAVIDSRQSFPKWAQPAAEKLLDNIIERDNDKRLVVYNTSYLPKENQCSKYQCGNIIGLKLKEMYIVSFNASKILQCENLYIAFELLVGEKKLIFLKDDLVKINLGKK